MSNLLFTEKDLSENFGLSFLEQGKVYQQQGLVTELAIIMQGTQLIATVTDLEKQQYKVEIKLTQDENNLWIDGICACEIGFNCGHITATLWHALQQQTETKVADSLTEPLVKPRFFSLTEERIVYVLSLQSWQQQAFLQVELCLVKPLKSGYYGKPKSLAHLPELQAYLQPIDEHLIKWLDFTRNQLGQGMLYVLTAANGSGILKQLILTERCHWVTANSPALKLGETRQGKLEWIVEDNGSQRLYCHLATESSTLFLLKPLWYLDHQRHLCGMVETGIDPNLASSLLAATTLKPDQIKQLHDALAKRTVIEKPVCVLPLNSEKSAYIKPLPILKLTLGKVAIIHNRSESAQLFEMQLPVAEISFSYANNLILHGDPSPAVYDIDSNQAIRYERDFTLETTAIMQLQEKNLTPLNQVQSYRFARLYPHYFAIHPEFEQHEIVYFSLHQVPELRKAGWQILIDENYPYIVIDEEETDWYSIIEEQDSNAWFNLELGITVNGEKINVLPLLVELIDQYFTDLSPAAIQAIPADKRLLARLPDGRYLPVPIARIRTILQVLTELYDSESLGASQKLRLSSLRSVQLVELEAAIGAARFRWFGGEQTRQLGARLKDFQGIQLVPVPENFKAELRPYQKEGLNWLQFLREYGLAGILADDMGLGKTVQTLAHILVEKQSGRMNCPSLVIAPTSLMVNWYMEAKRFAPDLKTLILHGIHRKPLFDQINEYDLILTTYPLLIRDKDILLTQEYHLLILDEAQIIKNPKSKAAQIVQLLKARHRLCLTGTPMENHLGELWSIFHFLIPGFLGEQEQFKKLFRNPIEKLNDIERRAVLANRIAPFLLRRTKQAVVHELPPKTEIIRMVELEGAQRDLYESIRASLHHQITVAIQNKGLASSHIIILDALLKLRQTCCDPRLLKLTSAKQFNARSAKLELLMDMLPSLVEEGRRVLIFSQFTGMLALIEAELKLKGLEYVILTGKTKNRAEVINKFQNGQIPLFLISLKAGGTGLNLTAADTVIHYDPWWNPAVENQATDRAHRIGQNKPVFVYKLLTTNTVEEKILALQAQKSALTQNLYNQDSATVNLLNQHDLLKLLTEPINTENNFVN